MGRVAHTLNRDDIGQPCIRIDVTAYDVQEVDQSAVLEHVRNLHALAGSEAAGQFFITGVANSQQKIFAYPLADATQDVEGKAHAVFQRAAVRAVEVIGQRRPELVHQMPVSLKLQTIETCRLHALRGVYIVLDDPLNVPFLHFLREGAVRRLAAV
ncbi:hypothetical protein D3C87_1437130 [compost metagenome]